VADATCRMKHGHPVHVYSAHIYLSWADGWPLCLQVFVHMACARSSVYHSVGAVNAYILYFLTIDMYRMHHIVATGGDNNLHMSYPLTQYSFL
jgi:hypothetical protein